MFDRFNRPVGYGQPNVFKDQAQQREPGQPGRPPNQNLMNALQPSAPPPQPPSPSLQNQGNAFGYNNADDRARSLPQQASSNQFSQQQQQQPAAPTSPYQSQAKRILGLEGFDHDKMQSGHVSPKYVFAQATKGLGGAADNDELLRRLKADPNGYFANARIGGSKNDKLIVDGQLDPKFEGINTFDFLRGVGLGQGGEAYQWGAEPPPGHPAHGQFQRAQVQQNPFLLSDQLLTPQQDEDDNDFIARILASLQQNNG